MGLHKVVLEGEALHMNYELTKYQPPLRTVMIAA